MSSVHIVAFYISSMVLFEVDILIEKMCDRIYTKWLSIQNVHAAINALTGIVNIHATSKSFVTPHLTAARRFTAPVPMILPVITCVVLTGTFSISVMKRVSDPAV